MECIQWFERRYGCCIPGVAVDADISNVQFRNGDHLQNVMTHGCRRFLLFYKKRHVICCRITETPEGRRVCKLMDTCREVYKGGSLAILEKLSECFSLPVCSRVDVSTPASMCTQI
jgi:hypothetical protein